MIYSFEHLLSLEFCNVKFQKSDCYVPEFQHNKLRHLFIYVVVHLIAILTYSRLIIFDEQTLSGTVLLASYYFLLGLVGI